MSSGITFGAFNGTSTTSTSGVTFTLSPLLNSYVLAVATWWNTAVGSNTGDLSISDSFANTWTRAFPTTYSPSTVAGAVGLSAWYAVSNAGGSDPITFSLSGGPYNHANFYAAYWANGLSPYLDTVASSASGTGETLTTNGVTPSLGNDALILCGGWNSTSGTPNAATLSSGYSYNSRVTGEPFTLQDFLYIGKGVSNQTAPFTGTVTTTLSSNADWVARVFSVPSSGPAAFASGDSVEASAGYFLPYEELYFTGYVFEGNYTGLSWLKNVFMMSRDYWDSGAYSRSTPYSGQLFPVGPGQGGSGQIYPY